MVTSFPRITFGIIVLNGEPFTRYNLRSLYRFAHEIIVVEGASPKAQSVASVDGHSTDGTLEVLRRFQIEEDPEKKLIVVTAEDHGYPDGFWPGEKDEQSQAYAQRATGDYLWQVDIDEFYHPYDIETILSILRAEPAITAVSFETVFFWGGFDYVTNGWYLMGGAGQFHRLFKWGSGYRYISHRPPTVCDDRGNDLRTVRWLCADDVSSYGIYLYHYALVFPQQVSEKVQYYAEGEWGEYSEGIAKWAQVNYLSTISHPFQIHNMHMYPSWLERFGGLHPDVVGSIQQGIRDGSLCIDVRPGFDVESLLSSKTYHVLRGLVKCLYPLHRYRHFPKWHILNLIRGINYDLSKRSFGITRDYIK